MALGQQAGRVQVEEPELVVALGAGQGRALVQELAQELVLGVAAAPARSPGRPAG